MLTPPKNREVVSIQVSPRIYFSNGQRCHGSHVWATVRGRPKPLYSAVPWIVTNVADEAARIERLP